MENSIKRPGRDEVIDLVSALVRIDSINPSLVPGAAGEGAIARFIHAWFTDIGVDVQIVEPAPGRPNVIARIPGRYAGPTLLLNAHIDTVGVAGMAAPFTPEVDGDRLYGRGAYDMKAGLAAIMLAAQAVARAGGAAGDLLITAVMDEEYTSLGTEAVVASLKADGAVVTEPTGLRLCTAHKGFAWFDVETHGRAAHGSKPHLGVDAIAHMGRFLGAMERLGDELAARLPHPLLGTGSIHASLIEGGQELSSYPESCRLQIERRTVPGETRVSVTDEIETLLAALHRADASFSATSEMTFWRDPFEVPLGDPLVALLERTCAEVTGDSPAVYGDTPWMDAAILQAAGIPTVVFGPGGAGAHALVEYASISEVAVCAQILAEVAMAFGAST